MPDRIIAEELAAPAAEHRPIGLPADLLRRRLVFRLVNGFDEHEGANGGAVVLRPHFAQGAFLGRVDGIDGQPSLAAEGGHGGVTARALGRNQVAAILRLDALGQPVDRPLVFRAGNEIPGHQPDDVGQVFELPGDKSSVLPDHLLPARLHVFEPAFVAAAIAEVRRREPDDDPVPVGPFDHLVGEVEIGAIGRRKIARPLEGGQASTRLGRMGAKVVLDQVDDHRVEALRLTVGKVVLGILFGELADQRPGGIADHQKRFSPLIDEKPAIFGRLQRQQRRRCLHGRTECHNGRKCHEAKHVD